MASETTAPPQNPPEDLRTDRREAKEAKAPRAFWRELNRLGLSKASENMAERCDDHALHCLKRPELCVIKSESAIVFATIQTLLTKTPDEKLPI